MGRDDWILLYYLVYFIRILRACFELVKGFCKTFRVSNFWRHDENPWHHSTRNSRSRLARVTEAAAMLAGRFMGRGDKEGADQAAVNAMRLVLSTVDMNGIIVIGEGEKDKAQCCSNGEKVGNGSEPDVDVAVDPIDGTRPLAFGLSNSIATVAVARAERCMIWSVSIYE